VNDVERLAETLRRANAELQVDPAELSDAVEHAHRRLVRRLVLVATLSALASALLLSGGLAASSAIKNNRQNSAGDNSDHSKASHKKHHDDNGNGNGGSGNANGNSGGDGGKGGHGEKEKERKHPDKSERTSGGGTEAKAEKLPELVVAEVTETEVVVKNESPYAAGPFYVLVTIPGTEYEEELIFEKGLAGEDSARQTLAEAPECPSEHQIVAVADPNNSVVEYEDENNTGATTCAESGVNEEESLGATQNGSTTTAASEAAPVPPS
jgi:CARDB